MSALAERLLLHPGVTEVEVSPIPGLDPEWREVRGIYLRAPFVYQVSATDDADAARAVIAKITVEWDAGELKPSEETTDG